MQHAQDGNLGYLGAGRHRLNAIDNEIRKACDAEFARVRRASGFPQIRMSVEHFDGIEDAPPDPRRCLRISGVQPFNDTQKVNIGWFGPSSDRYRFGATSRSKAATTVA